MTLISMSLNYGHPVLIADILLSSHDSNGEIKIPSFMNGTGNILKNVEGSKPIDKLVQKLYIINPQLCIAIGGRLDQMYSFLKAIKIYFEYHFPTEQELADFLVHYDEGKKTNLVALVLHATNEDKQVKYNSYFIGAWDSMKHKLFEEIFASGSGKEDYLKEIDFAINKIFEHHDSAAPENTFITAIIKNLSVFARFLGLESATARTLMKNWGAGFEIIVYVNGRFLKQDEITFLTMIGHKYLNQSFMVRPLNCLKFFYFDEALIIRANGTGQEQIFCAIPIDKEDEYRSFEITLPDYNSNVTLLTYIIKTDNDIYQTPSVVIPNNLETPVPSVKIKTENSRLEIMISNEIDNAIDFYISNNI